MVVKFECMLRLSKDTVAFRRNTVGMGKDATRLQQAASATQAEREKGREDAAIEGRVETKGLEQCPEMLQFVRRVEGDVE